MSGLQDYQKLMADWASSCLRPYLDEIKAGDPVKIEEQKLLDKIFTEFTDILNTYDALIMSEVLISVAPPRSKKIEHDKYIKYIVSTYLQDVYILKKRLNSYATRIKRLYKKSDRSDLVMKFIDPLFDFIKNSLESIVDTRGKHVHSKRYSDKELDDVSTMSLVSKYSPDFNIHFGDSVFKAKIVWYERIKSNNVETKKMLDFYFESLILVVKDNNTVFIP